MRNSTLEVEDGRSVLSTSSLGSHSTETVKNSTNTLQTQLRNRKFTAALGRVGYAKEARDAVAKLINRRAPPLAPPLDFEGFVTEFNAELETDTLRDLVIFPRDDIMLYKPCNYELSEVQRVANYYKEVTDWGIVKEALQHFSNPCSVIKFNYEGFFGDCEKYLANSGLEELTFESEDLIELFKEQEKSPIGTLREGFLMLEIKGENLPKILKGRKRRYCVLKRTVDEAVVFEISKQKDNAKTQFQVNSAHLKTFNKQRTKVLELILKDGTGQILAFPPHVDFEMTSWFQDVDLALKSVTCEDCEDKATEPSLSEAINESVKSSSSSGDHISRASLRQKNSIEALLRPPTVKRKNLFSLYENVEPLSRPCGENSAILDDSDDEYKLCMADPTFNNNTNDVINCHTIQRRRCSVDIRVNRCNMKIKTDEQYEQIETFYVNVFLFDVENGTRITNELSFTVLNEHNETLAKNSRNVFVHDKLDWEGTLQTSVLPSSAYVVVKIERLLSGVSSDLYFKHSVDRKTLTKNEKLLANAVQKLHKCRVLLGWSATPVNSKDNTLPVYKHEQSLSDADLKKLLGDVQKLQKAGKLVPIPNAQICLKTVAKQEVVDLPLKSLDRLVASDFYTHAMDRLNFDAFGDTDGHRSCKNQLFVYPTSLNFGSQKSFSRARNLLCTVSFVRQTNQPHLVDLNSCQLVHEQYCTVLYHEQNPNWDNEIKVELPVDLNENDHLLFEFSHISLSVAQKVAGETMEQKVGVAWLSLVKPDKSLVMKSDLEEFELPVAVSVPQNYYVQENGSPNRKASDATIKYVDNGKPLFKVKLRLRSTLYSSIAVVNKFFEQSVGGEFDVNCRALYEGLLEAIGILLSSDLTEQSLIVNTLSNLWFLLDVTIKSMTQTILTNGSHKYSRRRRFSQLTLEAIDTTFVIVSHQILNNHQKFPSETTAGNIGLAYFAKHCLNIVDRGFIYNSILEIVKKYDTNDIGLPRHYKLNFMQIIVSHEHWISLNLPMLFDSNNKPLLGLAGTKIEDHSQDALRVAKTSLRATNILSRLFFQFLPSPLTPQIQAKKTALNHEHFKLGLTFCSTHFLVGLLLQEFSSALRESRQYRKLVVAMVRNLFVKHSVDLRYDGAAAQSRIAILYAPFIQIIMENINEFDFFRRVEENGKINERKDSVKFDYAQSTARSILSKDYSLNGTARVNRNGSTLGHGVCSSNGTAGAQNSSNMEHKNSQFTEKLEPNEAKDLMLCALYLLKHLPKQVTVALAFNRVDSDNENEFLPLISLLQMALELFRCNSQLKLVGTNYANVHVKNPTFPTKDQKSLSGKQLKKAFIQESHLSQEVALIVLNVSHYLAEHIASCWNGTRLGLQQESQAFLGLIELKLELIGDQWPETVRLNALNSLGMFIELFSTQLSSVDNNEALPKLCQRLLLLLNSRLEKVQCSSAAILHLLIRQGFNATFEDYAKKVDKQPNTVRLPNEGRASADWLGNAGIQITIALAYLLGQNELSADCPRFENGIHFFECLTANQFDQKLELFKNSAQDLATQLRDILKATMSITEARNDPIKLAELHVKLADSYRGSPALRAAWFDTLSQIHSSEGWFSEAAICQAHCVAIIGKQLKARQGIEINFDLLSCLNTQLLDDEKVFEVELPVWHGGNFTVDALTSKVEETVKLLIQAERYEAVGPIYRISIPLFEATFNNKALTSVYADLHQAYSRATEIQTSKKRHLGAYFRVILHSKVHFGEEEKSSWIYREPALRSLAEESEKMVQLYRKILKTENVRFLAETELEPSTVLDPSIAYIQLTHVEPLLGEQTDDIEFSIHLKQLEAPDVNYTAHTNIKRFYFEKPLLLPVNEDSNEKIPEQARLALKRVFLTTYGTFPNTRRRLRIVKMSEEILNPLELACENLRKKAAQIQLVLKSASIADNGPIERSKLNALDLKGLQCLLQGSVSPTVNVGVLAYAEAFTADSQRSKYGVDGLEKLKQSFKVFMAQLARALAVNELAVSGDQAEYQVMLKNSFDGMLERLCTFFDGENFFSENLNNLSTKNTNHVVEKNAPPNNNYILDSISGIPRL
ncbi:unnamed protein product [Bursaphelenchus okinawaensis]|uniref:Uncharacterized protein n=1 Tax=Bursaphelenchus okinawaensis TaxID=465554 RepID=A0A811LW64_9BILA|nr:unnamed protein product [Bursaphelenchus okinawaensis]CAG9128681.1 unnamed protein product [Bursaphelenchus okinawaensis]